MNEKEKTLYKWLMKAFDEGSQTDPYSDKQSEYYSPLFQYKWIPQILNELENPKGKSGQQ